MNVKVKHIFIRMAVVDCIFPLLLIFVYWTLLYYFLAVQVRIKDNNSCITDIESRVMGT